jgi:hypothetical protein
MEARFSVQRRPGRPTTSAAARSAEWPLTSRLAATAVGFGTNFFAVFLVAPPNLFAQSPGHFDR